MFLPSEAALPSRPLPVEIKHPASVKVASVRVLSDSRAVLLTAIPLAVHVFPLPVCGSCPQPRFVPQLLPPASEVLLSCDPAFLYLAYVLLVWQAADDE